MQTAKLARLGISGLTLIGLSLSSIGCSGLPFGQPQPTRAVQPAAPTAVPTPAATETRAATATPVIPPPPAVSPPTAALTAAPLPDLSKLKLATKDLPGGFVDATAENLKRMNLTEEALNAAFGKLGAQARVQNFAALQHLQRAQLIVNFLIYPLTATEKTALTTQLASSDNALKAWGAALLGETGVKNAKPLAGVDKLGEKSVGFTTTTAMLGVNVRADAVLIVRDSVVQVALSFYPEPVPPAISAVDLAKLLDARLANALTGK